MHELGILINIAETITSIAQEQGIQEIQTLVLEIGELSPVVPHYIEECYPAAVHDTILENTELKIEIVPGIGKCRSCGETFNVVKHNAQCPACSHSAFDVLSGKDFIIKEIIAR
ncbi:MAG TPA: hydrogenase maturation nickel metallochaperone HypA [Spirochaetia bacterium]|nr:hydrogenase maturation nickel metallochaperone HypA [Spirochaetia bacterium]